VIFPTHGPGHNFIWENIQIWDIVSVKIDELDRYVLKWKIV